MAKKLILMLMILGFAYNSQAQSLEIGLFGGGSYFITDANPSLHFKNVKPAFGIVGRYYSGSRWAFRSSITKTDSDTLSGLTDVSILAEFNFFEYYTGSNKNYVSPYIFGGISTFFHNPKDANDNNLQISFPFGVGVKYSISKRVGVAFEWRMHKSMRDDLDRITLEPNKYQKDWYNFTGISFTYRLDLSNPGACKGFNNIYEN
ncbi:MAG: outer membrane beta-barrel protein [Bacteroidales bacterium]|nr:outer membrane beta-barrel protein [Bacteroidales bacterium]